MTPEVKRFIEDNIEDIDTKEYAYVLFNAVRCEVDYNETLVEELYNILLSIGIKPIEIYSSIGNDHDVCNEYQALLSNKGHSDIRILLAWQLIDIGSTRTYFDSVCVTSRNNRIKGHMCASEIRVSDPQSADEKINSFMDQIIKAHS